jgi:7-cyano-7-deazaguanine synthase
MDTLLDVSDAITNYSSSRRRACVLLSGGVDSAATLAFATQTENQSLALFVNYGQPAAEAERTASQTIAAHYAAPWRDVHLSGFTPTQGEILGRNAAFVHIALMVANECDLMLIGIHSGTGYRDCEPAFVAVMQQSLDFHTFGRMRLLAPFLEWTKSDLHAFAVAHKVPLDQTHSCAQSNIPCGSCQSCLDRATLQDARA